MPFKIPAAVSDQRLCQGAEMKMEGSPHPSQAAPRELGGAARRRLRRLLDRSDPPGTLVAEQSRGRVDAATPSGDKRVFGSCGTERKWWRIQIASLAKVSDLQINKRK